MRKIITFILFAIVFTNCSSDKDEYVENITSIKIEAINRNIHIGDEYQLTVTHTPDHLEAPEYLWESTDQNIVTVDKAGKIRAVEAGKATINAVVPNLGLSSSVDVIVLPKEPISITLDNKSIELPIGENFHLIYTIQPEDTIYREVVFSSSNEQVATVNDIGWITAVGLGEAVITVSVGDLKDECIVTVPETLFGFKFGSSMEQINPNVKISGDFSYNWSSLTGFDPPLRAFRFTADKMTSLWSCYDSSTFFYGPIYFLEEVKQFNPPAEITWKEGSNHSVILEQDSLSWKFEKYTVLIRNGKIPIHGNDLDMLIIEYSL